MALADLSSQDAVLRALEEFDQIGRERFLAKYGFNRARSYFLVRDGQAYDSKAIAGAAHGYQYPELGPLRAADFSGGDATVRARLEALGFTIVITEPTSGPVRSLRLFEDYSRREVHDIFAPGDSFTPGAGLWGLSGIVEYQHGDFILFVTFGREQGEHRFDEGVTTEGVVTWQSQPDQALADAQVRRLIEHDPERSNVRLFLRTRDRARGGSPMPYTYLGRLSYVTHDAERERPVYFQWQLIDNWPPSTEDLMRIGLQLAPSVTSENVQSGPTTVTVGTTLVETPPPAGGARIGIATATFRARRNPDRAVQDARNRQLGVAGERAVVIREQEWLRAEGRGDLADAVRHVAEVEGDGAGYDVASFELDGSDRFIEVKTTRGGPDTDFFISANEVEFSVRHPETYVLYRLYAFNPDTSVGNFYVRHGALTQDASVQLQPIQFRARIVVADKRTEGDQTCSEEPE